MVSGFVFNSYAEQPYSATPKQWWFVETARPCCASQLVDVQDLQRVALSGERVIEDLFYEFCSQSLSFNFGLICSGTFKFF